MSVMIQVEFLLYPVGHSDFLHALFSTICGRLEHGRWGSKYPYLMNCLYQGRLEWADIPPARKELEEVARRLAALAAGDVRPNPSEKDACRWCPAVICERRL